MPRIAYAKSDHRHYKRMVWSELAYLGYGTLVESEIGRCRLIPVQIEEQCTAEILGHVNETPIVEGNFRQCIYRDGTLGDHPAGGALVVESASVALAAASQKDEVAIASTTLTPGLYWLGMQIDTAGSEFYRPIAAIASGGTLLNYYYDVGGGYGPFTDPCPNVLPSYTQHQYIMISSTP